jgi:hypothetical protein
MLIQKLLSCGKKLEAQFYGGWIMIKVVLKHSYDNVKNSVVPALQCRVGPNNHIFILQALGSLEYKRPNQCILANEAFKLQTFKNKLMEYVCLHRSMHQGRCNCRSCNRDFKWNETVALGREGAVSSRVDLQQAALDGRSTRHRDRRTARSVVEHPCTPCRKWDPLGLPETATRNGERDMI